MIYNRKVIKVDFLDPVRPTFLGTISIFNVEVNVNVIFYDPIFILTLLNLIRLYFGQSFDESHFRSLLDIESSLKWIYSRILSAEVEIKFSILTTSLLTFCIISANIVILPISNPISLTTMSFKKNKNRIVISL